MRYSLSLFVVISIISGNLVDIGVTTVILIFKEYLCYSSLSRKNRPFAKTKKKIEPQVKEQFTTSYSVRIIGHAKEITILTFPYLLAPKVLHLSDLL